MDSTSVLVAFLLIQLDLLLLVKTTDSHHLLVLVSSLLLVTMIDTFLLEMELQLNQVEPQEQMARCLILQKLVLIVLVMTKKRTKKGLG